MLTTDDETKSTAFPNTTANVRVADETGLYANAGGKMYFNSMYGTSRVNCCLYPMAELLPSRNWLDAVLGIRGGVALGSWFSMSVGYKIASDDVLFT